MNVAHLLEASMLICFGFSWPLNVIKAYKARTAKGSSLAFIILIISGYVAGISAKFINHQINYVLGVYFLNLLIVSANVAVYVRNRSLDKEKTRLAEESVLKMKQAQINELIKESEKEDNMNYSNSLDELINPEVKSEVEERNSVILLGGGIDKKIPVAALAKDFDFNFSIYNKSRENLKLKDAHEYFQSQIKPLEPEGILIHVGESDVNLFASSPADFDNLYLTLIEGIKEANKKCRIALVSLANSSNSRNVAEMNRHIKAISESENCTFVNLDNAKLWNPEATKASVDFAYSTGLRMRKPLRNVAEILYSYAYRNIQEDHQPENLVG